MENKNDIPSEEQTSRLQQPAVGGSLPPAQQFREWQAEALKFSKAMGDKGRPTTSALCSEAMAFAYGKCAELLERQ